MKKKISYTDIYKIIDKAMKDHIVTKAEEFDIIKQVDKETREKVYIEYK